MCCQAGWVNFNYTDISRKSANQGRIGGAGRIELDVCALGAGNDGCRAGNWHLRCDCVDAPSIEVHFLDYPDKEINELGARGIGEIGLAGIAAAVTDAVHHATGVRVRELPVKIEDLLAGISEDEK